MSLSQSEMFPRDGAGELDRSKTWFNLCQQILHRRVFGVATNGISNAMMKPALDAYKANKKLYVTSLFALCV